MQYNNSIDDLKGINEKLCSYYDDLLANDSLSTEKNDINNKLDVYTSIYNSVGDDSFTSLISDVDSFKEIIDLCDLSDEHVSIILNVAIKCNLSFLDSNGIVIDDVDSDIVDMKNDNQKMQEEIKSLSNLLGSE